MNRRAVLALLLVLIGAVVYAQQSSRLVTPAEWRTTVVAHLEACHPAVNEVFVEPAIYITPSRSQALRAEADHIEKCEASEKALRDLVEATK